jgi:hypothetical protein
MSLYCGRAVACDFCEVPRRRSVSGLTIVALIGVLLSTLLIVSCSTLSGSQVPHSTTPSTNPKANVTLEVSPATADVTAGATVQLTAAVRGTNDTAVAWTASNGSVTKSGLFTAPSLTSSSVVTVTAVSLQDPLRFASATISVASTISHTRLAITSGALSSATLGMAYRGALAASGGTPPYRWSIASGALPKGLTLDSSSGAITGTPAQSGAFSMDFEVTDTALATATRASSLTVASSTHNQGNFDGPAELPRVYLQTGMADTSAPGTTISVGAGGDFQAALNNAECGDTIELQAGATFSGLFTVPAKSCDEQHWIIVRTSAPDSSLPPEGTRLTPCYAGVASLPGRPPLNCASTQNVLARIIFNQEAGSGPIQFATGANHYRFVGLEITRQVSGYIGALVSAPHSATGDSLVFDRVWMHGTAQDDTATGVGLGGLTRTAIINSYFSDFHCTSAVGTCTDAHAIGGGLGSSPGGPYQITNNFLEASGENILFGGGPATATPADIQINQNHFYKPLAWLSGQSGFMGGPGGHPFVVKNHLELKNAQRVLIEGNIFENTWGGFSQAGFSILLTPKNQYEGTSGNVCPMCQVTDVTIRYNTISHVGAGLQIANVFSDGGGSALAGERYSIHDITVDDVNSAKYAGGGGLVEFANGWKANVLNSVTIDHITAFPDPNGHLLSLWNVTSNPTMWGFTFTNNIVNAAMYPVWNGLGNPASCAYHDVPYTTITTCFSTYSFSRNAIAASPSKYPPSAWPTGNYFPADDNSIQFVNFNNGNGGDYHLLPSSPYKNAGTDGKDLGADIDAIQAAIAGVY